MQVLRAKTVKEMEDKIEDKVTEGYKLTNRTERQATLEKRTLGRAFWHILILLITVWFTFGLGNLLYIIYSYFANVDRIQIKRG